MDVTYQEHFIKLKSRKLRYELSFFVKFTLINNNNILFKFYVCYNYCGEIYENKD